MTRYTNPAEIIEISDSDTDAGVSERETRPSARAPGTQSAALASDSVLIIDSSDSDNSGNLDDWSDSNDSVELNQLLERLDLNNEPVVSGAPSKHKTQSYSIAEANSTINISSSDDEPSPVPFAIHNKNIDDKKASASQESLNLSAAIQRRDKRPGLPKPRPAEARTLYYKADAKLHRDVNKLVTDRKATIKEFTVEISYLLQDLPFVSPFSEALASHDGSVEFFKPVGGLERLIRFRRRHIARYDTTLKEWIPVESYTRLEDLYIMFLPADQLAQA
ncbi:hypothetical protein FRC08_017228, partial [Ceratobasidium sp. 394]